MGRSVSTDRLILHILSSLPRVLPQPFTESCRDRQGLKTLQASSLPEQYSAVQACCFLSRHWPLRKTAQEWAEPLSLGFVQQKLYLSMLQDFLHVCLIFIVWTLLGLGKAVGQWQVLEKPIVNQQCHSADLFVSFSYLTNSILCSWPDPTHSAQQFRSFTSV